MLSDMSVAKLYFQPGDRQPYIYILGAVVRDKARMFWKALYRIVLLGVFAARAE